MAVYFLQDSRGRIKIGYANDPIARMKTLQAGHVEPLWLMRSCPGHLAAEQWYHKLFRPQRICRDWFDFHDDMLTVEAPTDVVTKIPRPPNSWMPGVTIDELYAFMKKLEAGE